MLQRRRVSLRWKKWCISLTFLGLLFVYTITVLEIESYLNNKSKLWRKIASLQSQTIGIYIYI